MAKKPSPMDVQPVRGVRDLAMAMTPSPSKRMRNGKSRQPPVSSRLADASRRNSLRKQRAQQTRHQIGNPDRD
jgi:hypothetical protein